MIAENKAMHAVQLAFRQTMDAFARPGTVHSVVADDRWGSPEAGMSAPLEGLVRMFVDQAVDFAVSGGASRTERFVLEETRSRAVPLPDAAFVIVPCADEEALSEAVRGARGGSFVSPEKGATVLAAVGRLSQEPFEGACGIEVEGPGVKGTQRFYSDVCAWAEARRSRGDEYPCGIEIALVAEDGSLVAVPRSSSVRVLAQEGGR